MQRIKLSQKVNKRTRVISQQAIQIKGDKFIADFDNFSNMGHQNKHSGNFDNFISLGTHYGSNKHLMHPSFEISKRQYSENLIVNSRKFDHLNTEFNRESSGDRNYLIISQNDNLKLKNVSIEEQKSNKSQHNHSPLLTKRKISQRRTTENTRRQNSKKSIDKSQKVSLNMNLRSHPKASHSESRNTERILKLSSDMNQGIQIKDQLDNDLHKGFQNINLKHKNILSQISSSAHEDLLSRLKSLESAVGGDSSNILNPSSKANQKSNRRKDLKSRQSSRNSKNHSQSNSKRYNTKYIISKASKDVVSKEQQQLNVYKAKNNLGKAIKRENSSGSRSKSKKLQKLMVNPAYPSSQVYLLGKSEIFKQYKHNKSNSETTDRGVKYLSKKEINQAEKNLIYSNLKAKNFNFVSKNKIKNKPSLNPTESECHNFVGPGEFNTVKYSQSPFLNKLTSLKKKKGIIPSNKISLGKGHKSRNSMFPKSYTEVTEQKRREMEIYGQFNTNSIERIPEEDTLKRAEETKASNPYMNIEVEHEIISAYGNEHSSTNNRQGLSDNSAPDQKQKVKIESDKKRGASDTTRSKTGIDASDDTTHSNRRHLFVSAEKKVQAHVPKPHLKKEPHDYYQLDRNEIQENKKGEVISILSYNMNETGKSSSKSYDKELNKKQSKRKQVVQNYFENQKTQKQNIKYLKEQFNAENSGSRLSKNLEESKTKLSEAKIQDSKDRRPQNRQEYREDLLNLYIPLHIKSKSHRNKKVQYIRNNHDIISKHQRHKSTDSTDNSILKRSNGFEILYKRGERLAKMLNHSEELIQTPASSSILQSSSNNYAKNQNLSELKLSELIQSEQDQSSSSEISEIMLAPQNFETAGQETKKSVKDILNLLDF